MKRRIPLVVTAVLLLLVTGSCWATTFTVRNANDSGTRSLRWAIEQANTNAGPDLIRFAPRMTGKVIRPLTPLPALTDGQTTIDGDGNDDGAPDVALNGNRASGESGLLVQGDHTYIYGLAITNFPKYGILVEGASSFRLRFCHLGVNLAGTAAVPNRWGELRLSDSTAAVIGGNAKRRNIIGTGNDLNDVGILITQGGGHYVRSNYFGLTRDGMSPLLADPSGAIKISSSPSSPSLVTTIGGDLSGAGNVFGRVRTGVQLTHAQNTRIMGNLFGLMADGSTLAKIDIAGVYVESALTTGNVIGGATPGSRNVFAGGGTGVRFVGAGSGNKVQGNWFGTNGAGTRRRRLITGVSVGAGAEPQLIGGASQAAGNYFVTNHPKYNTQGCYLIGDNGTVVRHNLFGKLPNGRDAPTDTGVNIQTGVTVRDNTFVRCNAGVLVYGATAKGSVFGNLFRGCSFAVSLDNSARGNLGNLGNTRTTDDGGNVFRPDVFRCINNKTPYRVKAEGNDFGTTSRAAINARIWDKRDDGSLGRVDFSPLLGGVLPTESTEGALTVVALATAPAPGGAQIILSLSSAAQVQARILNIAGRPVRTLCHAKDFEAGTNNLLWNGQSDNGLPAPNGRYLIRVAARNGRGQPATALTALRLER